MNIEKDSIIPQLNRCYIKFDQDWEWGTTPNEAVVQKFVEHIREEAGIDMYVWRGIVNDMEQYGWKINAIELIDEQKFMLWMLKWS